VAACQRDDATAGVTAKGAAALTRPRNAMTAYAVWLTMIVVLYYALPSLRPVTWGLLALTGAAAIGAGVAVNRPTHRAPWLLLAVANLSFATAQVSFLVLTQYLHQRLPFPSVLDALYLMTYPLYAAGLALFTRWRVAGPDRRSTLDALILTVAFALLAWLYLILPYARASGLGWEQKAVAIAYPVGDVLVLAMLMRLLAPRLLRSVPGMLMTLGTAGLLASDVAYGLTVLHGTFHPGTAIDLGWAVFYAAWGAAALHPAMTKLSRPVPRQRAGISVVRLVLLMLASLAAPIALFVEATRGIHRDAGVIAVFSAVLYLLVLWRLADVAVAHRLVFRRERVLRAAAAGLASAVTVEEISAAVRKAATALAGRNPRFELLLAVREGRQLRPAGAAPPPGELRAGSAARSEQLQSLLQDSLPDLAGLAGGDPPQSRLVHPPPATARVPEQLTENDAVLLCPLSLRDRPVGDPLIGALAVSGGERDLAALTAAFETLARQTALAVERVILSQELGRRDSETYFRTLVQDTSDVILIIAEDGRIHYATPSASGIFGDVSVEGAYLADLIMPAERDAIRRSLARMRECSTRPDHETWRLTRRNGTSAEVEVRCSDLRGDHTVEGLVLTLRDVTTQRELERELKHRAFHDALTGLPNRLLFTSRIGQALARARRDGRTIAVLLVDLDDFKLVNDTMGHGGGDELLAAVAERLSGLVSAQDTAARLGGDEFALLVEKTGGPAAIEAFADEVERALAEPFALHGGSVMSTATIGVATTEDSSDAGDLIRHADLALYAAKAAGKRQWRRYAPVLSVGMAKQRELQAAIGDAVTNHDFSLAYQPIVALTSGEVAGFEALLRWPHPRWGMIHPGQFITLAEETGHIVPLGAWVLERAATDLDEWQRSVPHQPPLYVSVNVSARQFTNPGFVAGVRRALAASGLDPSSLVLELTESVLLHRNNRITDEMIELKRIGVRLAIDDFGTGYSSLGYLRELPIDVLKIDKSFVEGIALSRQRLALVDVIVKIAKTLGLTVMAEGIESEVQRDLLISLGCEYGQGYLLDRPLGAAEAAALVRSGSVAELRPARH
jgi:diguanylate cyclase (GGDEF)-like protein/PAS domain S-box-containing protein